MWAERSSKIGLLERIDRIDDHLSPLRTVDVFPQFREDERLRGAWCLVIDIVLSLTNCTVPSDRSHHGRNRGQKAFR